MTKVCSVLVASCGIGQSVGVSTRKGEHFTYYSCSPPVLIALLPPTAGLIHKAYIAKRDNQPFEIWGTGKPLRQFIYSLDLGRLFIWTLRNYDSVSPLILSVDEADEISIGDVSKLVLKATKFEGEIKYLTEKADGQVIPR